MEIRGFYIYNGSGKISNFNTLNEMERNLGEIKDVGYNAIGINYQLNGSDFPGSIDVITRYDGGKFSLSSDLKSSYYSNLLESAEFTSSLGELEVLIGKLNS